MKRRGLWILLALMPLGCAWMGAYSPLGPLERKLVYQPEVFPAGDWDKPTPDTENVWFKAPDGTALNGWYLEHPEPRGVALICHGNAGSITSFKESLRRLHDENQLSVMTFDYRGFGRSEGSPSEAGLLQDARAARDWLSHRTGVPPDELILMGYSLGGEVAVDLAANDGARGLVLWSTFSNLPETAGHHYSWLPTNLLMTQRFDSLAKIENYDGPLLQSHGDSDRVIPYRLALRLHERHHGSKRFITIPGADHIDADSPEYRVVLAEFIERICEPVSTASAVSRRR